MKLINYLKSANRVTHTHLVLRTTNDVIIRGFGTIIQALAISQQQSCRSLPSLYMYALGNVYREKRTTTLRGDSNIRLRCMDLNVKLERNTTKVFFRLYV